MSGLSIASMSGLRAAAAAAALMAAVVPAFADCYDILGCTDTDLFSRNYSYLASPSDGPNCDFLWQMRNRIYAEHGYCFHTARGIAEMGNAGCRYNDAASVPLNRIEQANIATIQQAERVKGCAP